MIYVSNAFSLAMLSREEQSRAPGWCGPGRGPRIPSPCADPRAYLAQAETVYARAGQPGPVQSIIGHADVARLISAALGRELAANRATVTLGEQDVLLVAQYV